MGYVAVEFCSGTLPEGYLGETTRKTKWIEREEDLIILLMVYTHTIRKVSREDFY